MSSVYNETAEQTVALTNKRGLHARASAKFVDVAGKFKSEVTVEKAGQEVSGKSILGLMLLAAAKGEEITITARGRDAEQAVMMLGHLVASGFYETD
jgi:phosphocarrier protein